MCVCVIISLLHESSCQYYWSSIDNFFFFLSSNILFTLLLDDCSKCEKVWSKFGLVFFCKLLGGVLKYSLPLNLVILFLDKEKLERTVHTYYTMLWANFFIKKFWVFHSQQLWVCLGKTRRQFFVHSLSSLKSESFTDWKLFIGLQFYERTHFRFNQKIYVSLACMYRAYQKSCH